MAESQPNLCDGDLVYMVAMSKGFAVEKNRSIVSAVGLKDEAEGVVVP